MWYGFRFSPFLNFTMGFLGDEEQFLFDSRLYSRIGLGVLITNDYLVFNSFQISFAFYPVIPNDGSNIFKTNSFKNSDFGLQDFQIGKPRSEEHTSELQSRENLVCRLLLEKKKNNNI